MNAPSSAFPASAFPATTVTLAGDVRVVVRRCGREAGPVFVLLHGISSGSGSWRAVAPALGEHGRVVAWDAPGYDDSTPLATPTPGAGHYAARLGELLVALDVERCVLVGHSLGALMAAAFAGGPERARVERLVLISPAGGYGAPDKAVQRDNVRRQRLSDLGELGIGGIAERLPARLLSAGATDAQRRQVRETALRLNPRGYAQAVEMLCSADLGLDADLPRPPTSVHCGDADVVTPPEACARWAATLGAPFALIANAGHASPVEQPVAVARAILATAAAA